MYSYIIGEFVEMTPEGIVIENNGIGYDIKTSSLTAENIPKSGEFVKVYTYLHVREDDMSLYGFLTRDDLEVFRQLITVSGIGPKAGIAILSVMTGNDLRYAIMAGDSKSISKAPGVGAKTAQKVILELKDKMAKETAAGLDFSGGKGAAAPAVFTSKATEAAAALSVLGYSTQEVQMALKGVDVETLPLEEIIRQSLKKMVK